MASGSTGLQGMRRELAGEIFRRACQASVWTAGVVLTVLLIQVLSEAWGWVDWQFISSTDSRFPEKAGILTGLWGSIWLLLLTGLIAVPVGIGAAIYLEEYSRDNWLARLIKVNLANLAGVPSIVFGILGLTVFVRTFGLVPADPPIKVVAMHLGVATIKFWLPIPLGRTLLAGALTISLMILPIIIVAAQEALRSVPQSIRHAALALGATKWQTISKQVLPAALPGILTGVILSMSRAIGEAAPLIMIGALGFTSATPGQIRSPLDIVRSPGSLLEVPLSPFTVLPIQILNWVEHPVDNFKHVAAAGIMVLLVVLLSMNGLAIWLRQRSQKHLRW